METGNWIVEGKLYACRYPRTAKDWDTLVRHRVTTVINLHAEPHLSTRGIAQEHMYVPNFCAPSVSHVEHVLAILNDPNQVVAIHCLAGLGRTGTMAACYLVSQGMTAQQAMDHVRQCRPGSIESRVQEQFVVFYAQK